MGFKNINRDATWIVRLRRPEYIPILPEDKEGGRSSPRPVAMECDGSVIAMNPPGPLDLTEPD